MYSDVFATCSMNDIRVWNAKNRQELLRIEVPNLECFCVGFMQDGKSIGGTLEQNVPWSDDADGGNACRVNECYSLVSGGVLRNTETFITSGGVLRQYRNKETILVR